MLFCHMFPLFGFIEWRTLETVFFFTLSKFLELASLLLAQFFLSQEIETMFEQKINFLLRSSIKRSWKKSRLWPWPTCLQISSPIVAIQISYSEILPNQSRNVNGRHFSQKRESRLIKFGPMQSGKARLRILYHLWFLKKWNRGKWLSFRAFLTTPHIFWREDSLPAAWNSWKHQAPASRSLTTLLILETRSAKERSIWDIQHRFPRPHYFVGKSQSWRSVLLNNSLQT